MDKVAILNELKVLAATAPDFALFSPTSRLHMEWLGKATALVTRWDSMEGISLRSSVNYLGIPLIRESNIAQIFSILHRAIASLELDIPTLPNQAFGPGAVYDFMKTLRDLLASAVQNILIVDPYLDDQIFDAYLSAISPMVSVRLLAREYAAALKPALEKFVAQNKMNVEIRHSKSIHDRVVFLDNVSCWVLGQSIKDAAKSKPTYIAPLSSDAAQLKKADYDQIWVDGKKI